jgi:hypothetical protein
MGGLQTYIRTKEDWRQWKDPAAWLNGERWNDEPTPSQPHRSADDHIGQAYAQAIMDERLRASDDVVGGVQ